MKRDKVCIKKQCSEVKKYEHLLKLRSMCISIEAEKTEGEGRPLLMQGRWRLGCNMTKSDIGPETQFEHRLRQNREWYNKNLMRN